jgi:hypothetical protein
MADDERKALIVQGPRSLAEVGAGARKILSSVVSDALTVASSREKALTPTRFRIGNYEFREPDYGQILLWAKTLEIDPEVLVQTLEKTPFTCNSIREKVIFTVEKGAIASLSWDVAALPLKKFDWVTGLSIRELAVFCELVSQNISLSLPSLPLPSLRALFIDGIKLTKLDLSKVPNLTRLSCERNQLTELDLSKTPNLTTLRCRANRLTELNLSGVQNLTELSCHHNRLTELDLPNVPNLTRLWCGRNQLAELDLSKAQNLTRLWCSLNQLTELDLSKVPNLTTLSCGANQLTQLDLTALPNLATLRCEKNLITELEVTTNTALTDLHCDGSVRVVKLPSQNFKRPDEVLFRKYEALSEEANRITDDDE